MATQLFDEEEYSRWLEQAEHTLASARRDTEAGDYDWACFKAQQAAEYAVKGLLWGFGLPAFGHSILRLFGQAEEQGLPLPKEIQGWARTLDRHYIPPRYPNAYPSGAPFEFYDQSTAEEALRCSQAMVEAIEEVRARYACI
ncbi:MAG: HEPN domain-containing protein [Chloroflexota bacterium]|nr:HEPN domain-containing protein [Chloroflexota bacterium]